MPPLVQDDTPRVVVNVGGKLSGGTISGGTDIVSVLDYSYTTDIVSLTDSATIDVANKDGLYTGVVTKGSRVIVSMADPNVAGGAMVPRLVGLVVNPRMTSRGGEKIQLQCADQGWYLERCDAPLWANLQASKTLLDFTNKLLQGPHGEDFGWGFQNADKSLNVLWNNVTYQQLLRQLNQGAAGAQRSVAAQALKSSRVLVDGTSYVAGATLPPLQVEAGMKVGQLLIDYARRAKLLVNVSADGALMFFKPNYSQPVSYRIDYHHDNRNQQNGVLDVTVDDSVDGIATDVWCTAQNPWYKPGTNPTDFNADKLRARYQNASAVPHYMRMTFGDADQVGQSLVQKRAEWAQQRGMFDAFAMTVEVYGHRQGGLFWAPDSMVAVNDSVHGISGNFYLSACRYQRDRQGTRTTLTLRRPFLLGA